MSVLDLVRERGRLTVAAFMDLALYEPELGYYARAARRSGRAGDFFTSVDVGPLFGQLLAEQIAEMAALLDGDRPRESVDLVEAGAGNGRLAADVLRALERRYPPVFDRARLHLSERSAAARAQHGAVLDDLSVKLVHSGCGLPNSFEGVLFANELLDAVPAHQVVMRADGLHEIYVEAEGDRLVTVEGPLSTPALAAYLDGLDITLEPGWRVEIGLLAVDWMREAARRLRRGFVVLVDYGHEARELYSAAHAGGTLASYRRHGATGPESSTPGWLTAPGEQDLTVHVNLTAIQSAAEAEGLRTLGLLDQTYFLFGLAGLEPDPPHPANVGNLANPENPTTPENPVNLLNPGNPALLRAFRTLTMPGGLGSTMKVLILGRDVGSPALRGCSYKVRLT
jgi:SAM-dependent MidA family methyltransferase